MPDMMAGLVHIIPAYTSERCRDKIINTRPSVLTKYSGKGVHSIMSQEAVMQAKEEKAGFTVHFVNAGMYEGKIILQKTISLDYNETLWQLDGRIFKEENYMLVNANHVIKANIKNDF